MEIVEEMKQRTGMPYQTLCKGLRLSLSSLSRWRMRIRNNQAVLNQPGPKKVVPFDASVLDAQIRSLSHGAKRSAGTTQLYRCYRFHVSRRELGCMVERVRRELVSDYRHHLRRVEWLTPGITWAIDGTKYDVGLPSKIYLCNMQDLGSRYKFLPLAGEYPVGEEIAGYLSEKFDRYGAPLVLKRDNEGIMNHSAVNSVLEDFFVLSLNNPDYYAPYNGAIEESQREIKSCLREKVALGVPECRDHISAYAEAAINDLNHRIRPCLKGRTSCQAFFAAAHTPAFTKRQRREIYDAIIEKVERILSVMKETGQDIRQLAWRIALESWLRSKGYITVHTPKSVTQFYPAFSS